MTTESDQLALLRAENELLRDELRLALRRLHEAHRELDVFETRLGVADAELARVRGPLSAAIHRLEEDPAGPDLTY